MSQKGYVRVLDFKNENGKFIFEFQPLTEDDIKEVCYYIFIMMKKMASNIHSTFSDDLFRDFLKALMDHKILYPTASFHETTLSFFLNYKNGEAAPVISARTYEDRPEYVDEFTIVNMQKKTASLGFTFKARTDNGIYKASFIIYFLLVRSGALISADSTNDLYLEFRKTFDELIVKNPDQNHSNTLFEYYWEFAELKPRIRVKQE